MLADCDMQARRRAALAAMRYATGQMLAKTLKATKDGVTDPESLAAMLYEFHADLRDVTLIAADAGVPVDHLSA